MLWDVPKALQFHQGNVDVDGPSGWTVSVTSPIFYFVKKKQCPEFCGISVWMNSSFWEIQSKGNPSKNQVQKQQLDLQELMHLIMCCVGAVAYWWL